MGSEKKFDPHEVTGARHSAMRRQVQRDMRRSLAAEGANRALRDAAPVAKPACAALPAGAPPLHSARERLLVSRDTDGLLNDKTGRKSGVFRPHWIGSPPKQFAREGLIPRDLEWWAHLDSNQGPTGYEPVALSR